MDLVRVGNLGMDLLVVLATSLVFAYSCASLAVPNSNLQPDFNVRICDGFDKISSAVLRELDESNRFVQRSAESTSI